jgi:hypothetical protein
MIENIQLTDPVAQIIAVLLGIIILVAGRKLFWLTVGAVGFIISLGFALNFLEDQPAWIALVIALVAGGIGAVLALVLQQVVVVIAGFLISGYSALWLLQTLALDLSPWEWTAFIIAGVIGSIFALYVFEIALVILSSMIGATMILQVTQFEEWLTLLLFVVLIALGIYVQSRASR